MHPLRNPRRMAIAQMAMAWTTAENTRTVLHLLQQAAQGGAALVVFPELALTGFHREIRREAQPAPVADALAQVAAACAQHHMAAAVGAPAWWPGEPRPLNVHVLIDAQGQVQAQVPKIGLTPSEASFFAPGAAPRPVATLAGWRCSSVLCREVEDAEALAEQLPPGRADLLLWPSLVGHDPALMAAQGWPDYLPLAQAVARRSAATVLQCNWPWALNNPESRHAGESAVIGPDGALLLRLPRDAAGLALFNLGETDFDWLPQAGAQHPGDSPADGAPLYFSHPAGFRDWLQAQGTTARSLLVGFHKVGSGTPAMRWPESVDEALCVGWIDGVRTRVDAQRYTIRFTPRKPGSHWSAVNVARMAELIAAGRVSPAGLAAWAQRDAARTARASYEQPGMPSLPPQAEAEFRTHPQAWAWFSAQAPSYRKKVIWNLLKAKQPATAARHLARLIEASAQQRRL